MTKSINMGAFVINMIKGATVLATVGFANAQEFDDPNLDRNPWSVSPIRKADIMYQKTLWLSMDLREKQNTPFFADNNEITKVIIEATKSGLLRPFKNDSLTSRLSSGEFLENLKIPGVGEIEQEVIEDEETWGEESENSGGWNEEGETTVATESVIEEFFPSQIFMLELKEDLVFDKRRSRMYHDLQSIKLVIPGELYPTGLDKELAVFSYKELVNNVFKNNPVAVWYNPYNTAEHKNLSDAFDLRLFSAHLIKYSNPEDSRITDLFGEGKAGLASAQAQEHQYVEYESNLWSN